jgi:hypothetical protein
MQQPTASHENMLRNLLIVAMIFFAAVIRIVPHPWNLAPVGAMALVYASFVVSIMIGWLLRERRSIPRVGAAVLLGAIQFFLVTNLGVWVLLNSYPKTLTGLAACYIAGLPLFWNTLAGDALFSVLLFGTLLLAERAYPTFRPNVAPAS